MIPSTTSVATAPVSPVVIVVATGSGVAAGLGLAALGGDDAPWMGVLTVLLAVALALPVPVPWGGGVPLGFALAGALPALPARAEVVVPAAVALVVIAAATRGGKEATRTVALRLAPPTLAALAAGAIHGIVQPGAPVLARVVVTAGALLVVDAVIAVRWPPDGQRLDPVQALAVHLTLACGAALIAVATSGFGVVMALVAAFPLLITRFSFQRDAEAKATLHQTVQALGLVPELAGVAALGHSERSAVYADAMARELGLGRSARNRIVTAVRLEHLGAVSFETNQAEAVAAAGGGGRAAPPEIARQGAAILRQSRFPDDVAVLLEAAGADAPRGEALSLEAAVVRVAASFDAVVGEDEAAVPHALSLVSGSAGGAHGRRAVAALLELTAASPDLVPRAIAAGDRFRGAAVGLDLEALLATTPGGDILPFHRRRDRTEVRGRPKPRQ